jgi:hypothetical protein
VREAKPRGATFQSEDGHAPAASPHAALRAVDLGTRFLRAVFTHHVEEDEFVDNPRA